MHAEAQSKVPSIIGGGETGQLVRDLDWSASPLGDYATWPQSLRSALSMVLNTKGIAALYWGPEQWLLYNDAYAAALGDRHPWAFGRPMPEALPDIAPVLGPQVEEVLRTGSGFAIENLSMVMHRYGKDEEAYWTYGFSPVQGEDEGFAGVLLLATEMTQQRKVEAALLESKTVAQVDAQRVQLALAAGAIIGTWNWYIPDDQFTIDDAFARAFGLDPALGREGIPLARITATVHPEDQAGLSGAIHAAIERGGAYAHQYRVRRSDGCYYWIEANGRVEHGPDRTPLRFPGVLIDLEDRRNSDKELAESQELLRLATDIGEIGEWHVDQATGAMFWPPRVKAMFGISADVPVTLDDYYNGVHPDDREATLAAYHAASDPDRRALYEMDYRTVGSEDGIIRWVAARGRGLFDAEGVCYRVIGTAIDITERKTNEIRLRELNEHLEQEVTERLAERNLLATLVETFATQALNELGYTTKLAVDAAAALIELGSDGNGFDLVFSDVVMPRMSGIELGREIHRRVPGLPVVLASGYSDVLAGQDDVEFELLHKPYSLEELAKILARVSGGKRV